MKVENKRWTDEEFFAEREKVLKQWPTGDEVDSQEAIDFLKKIPAEKNFAEVMAKAKREGKT